MIDISPRELSEKIEPQGEKTMTRKLTVMLLVAVLCLIGISSALAYNQAPMFKVKVAAGELPPVEERLPDEPMVVEL